MSGSEMFACLRLSKAVGRPRRCHRAQHAKRCRIRCSEASGTNADVVSGIAQFKIRGPEAF
eukprot:3980361-Alexandrium_andersonii.AAC.1